MNAIDIVILVPVLWFAYKGFTKGLIIELATLIALLLGIYIAGHFSDFTASWIEQNLDFHSPYMGMISFTVTFLAVVLLVMLFGKSLEKVVNLLMLSFINKISGALFGLIKVVFVMSVFLMILSNFDLEEKIIPNEYQHDSFLYQPVKSLAPAVFPVLMREKDKLLDKVKI